VPKADVFYYAENGKAPAPDWYLEQPDKVQDRFYFLFEQLEEKGSSLQRPHAAPLNQKIYELRARLGKVNYRLLYFFDADGDAVVAHGCKKEGEVDPADITRAAKRREEYLGNPASHLYNPE
jgi:hypothetical protein